MFLFIRGPLPVAAYLAAFAAALVLPFLIIAGVAVVRYADAERVRLEADARELRDEVLGRLDRDTSTKIVMLEALATSPALDGAPDFIRFDAQARALSKDVTSHILLLSPDGQRRFVSTKAPLGSAPHSEPAVDEVMRRARDTRKPAVSDLHAGPNSGQLVTVTVVPVEREGEVRFLLASVSAPIGFRALLVEQGVAPPFYASLVDRSGTIVARSSRHDDFVGTKLPGTSALPGPQGTWSGINPQGISVQAFYRRSELSGWLVTLGVDQAALQAPLSRSLLWLAALASGLTAVAAVVVRLLSQRLAQSWKALTGAAKALGEGQPFAMPDTPIREANHIGSSLAQASGKLREHSETIIATNSVLEQRVAERTRELTVARDKAEAAGRAKAEFLANMSHELRTPLTAVIGASELLLKGYADGNPSKQRQYLEMQRDAGEGLLGIINDILDFSKIEAGQLGMETLPLSLRELAAACLDLVAEQASKRGIALDGEVASAVPDCVLGDTNRLRQILLNLLSNAIKFTAKGSVRLTVTLVGEGLAQQLRFAVEDSGRGIRPDRLALIFQRFSQEDSSTTRQFGGTGLGLAIAKSLVELMGGTLDVQSRLGEGSTFAFVLPLMPVPALHPARSAVDRGGFPPSSGRRVLLAEDNSINQEIIAGMLRDHGHEVTIVGDGRQAVETVTGGQLGFDVILMDVQMPEMDGYEATRLVRRLGCRVPIIALTASALSDEIERCHAAGMDLHIAKPVKWTKLFGAIEALAAKKLPAAA